MLFLSFVDMEIAKQLTMIEFGIFSKINVKLKFDNKFHQTNRSDNELLWFWLWFKKKKNNKQRHLNYSIKLGTLQRKNINRWMSLKSSHVQIRFLIGSHRLSCIRIILRHASKLLQNSSTLRNTCVTCKTLRHVWDSLQAWTCLPWVGWGNFCRVSFFFFLQFFSQPFHAPHFFFFLVKLLTVLMNRNGKLFKNWQPCLIRAVPLKTIVKHFEHPLVPVCPTCTRSSFFFFLNWSTYFN